MPYPTEHSARIRDPGDFDPKSFKSKEIKSGIRIILGKLNNGNGSMITQAYRFSTDNFTVEQAKKWLKDNNVSYLTFEPAEIKHVGILGMRWGVRKGSSEGSSSSNKHTSSEDYNKARTIKKKKIKEMSNEELRTFATRLQLERQYKDLNQSSISKGKKIVAEVLLNAGKETAKNFVQKKMESGANKLWDEIVKQLK